MIEENYFEENVFQRSILISIVFFSFICSFLLHLKYRHHLVPFCPLVLLFSWWIQTYIMTLIVIWIIFKLLRKKLIKTEQFNNRYIYFKFSLTCSFPIVLWDFMPLILILNCTAPLSCKWPIKENGKMSLTLWSTIVCS